MSTELLPVQDVYILPSHYRANKTDLAMDPDSSKTMAFGVVCPGACLYDQHSTLADPNPSMNSSQNSELCGIYRTVLMFNVLVDSVKTLVEQANSTSTGEEYKYNVYRLRLPDGVGFVQILTTNFKDEPAESSYYPPATQSQRTSSMATFIKMAGIIPYSCGVSNNETVLSQELYSRLSMDEPNGKKRLKSRGSAHDGPENTVVDYSNFKFGLRSSAVTRRDEFVLIRQCKEAINLYYKIQPDSILPAKSPNHPTQLFDCSHIIPTIQEIIKRFHTSPKNIDDDVLLDMCIGALQEGIPVSPEAAAEVGETEFLSFSDMVPPEPGIPTIYSSQQWNTLRKKETNWYLFPSIAASSAVTSMQLYGTVFPDSDLDDSILEKVKSARTTDIRGRDRLYTPIQVTPKPAISSNIFAGQTSQVPDEWYLHPDTSPEAVDRFISEMARNLKIQGPACGTYETDHVEREIIQECLATYGQDVINFDRNGNPEYSYRIEDADEETQRLFGEGHYTDCAVRMFLDYLFESFSSDPNCTNPLAAMYLWFYVHQPLTPGCDNRGFAFTSSTSMGKTSAKKAVQDKTPIRLQDYVVANSFTALILQAFKYAVPFCDDGNNQTEGKPVFSDESAIRLMVFLGGDYGHKGAAPGESGMESKSKHYTASSNFVSIGNGGVFGIGRPPAFQQRWDSYHLTPRATDPETIIDIGAEIDYMATTKADTAGSHSHPIRRATWGAMQYIKMVEGNAVPKHGEASASIAVPVVLKGHLRSTKKHSRFAYSYPDDSKYRNQTNARCAAISLQRIAMSFFLQSTDALPRMGYPAKKVTPELFHMMMSREDVTSATAMVWSSISYANMNSKNVAWSIVSALKAKIVADLAPDPADTNFLGVPIDMFKGIEDQHFTTDSLNTTRSVFGNVLHARHKFDLDGTLNRLRDRDVINVTDGRNKSGRVFGLNQPSVAHKWISLDEQEILHIFFEQIRTLNARTHSQESVPNVYFSSMDDEEEFRHLRSECKAKRAKVKVRDLARGFLSSEKLQKQTTVYLNIFDADPGNMDENDGYEFKKLCASVVHLLSMAGKPLFNMCEVDQSERQGSPYLLYRCNVYEFMRLYRSIEGMGWVKHALTYSLVSHVLGESSPKDFPVPVVDPVTEMLHCEKTPAIDESDPIRLVKKRNVGLPLRAFTGESPPEVIYKVSDNAWGNATLTGVSAFHIEAATRRAAYPEHLPGYVGIGMNDAEDSDMEY